MLTFEIYAEGSPSNRIGTVSASVGEIFGLGNRGLKKGLSKREGEAADLKLGEIHLFAEPVELGHRNWIGFELRGSGIPVPWVNWYWSYNFYVKFIRCRGHNEREMARTEMGRQANCNFGGIKLDLRRVTNNDPDFPINIQLVKIASSEHSVIGWGEITIRSLREGQSVIELKKGPSLVARLEFRNRREWMEYSFPEYIDSGMQLALTIGIDFTASNGIRTDPKSLHYTGRGSTSPYEKALSEVTKIMMDYDYDKMVPVWGFGAKLRYPKLHSRSATNHCFPLTGDMGSISLYQLDSILQAYHHNMQYLEFAGPTYFGPLIENAMRTAQEAKEVGKEYYILLILTDGQINDFDKVIDLLVACSRIPLSVVIIGIGPGPWDLMTKIDDDDAKMLDSKGRRTERDLVQFVEFNKFGENGIVLAREVLAEIPRQIVQYHSLVNIPPSNYQRFKSPPRTDAEAQLQHKPSELYPSLEP